MLKKKRNTDRAWVRCTETNAKKKMSNFAQLPSNKEKSGLDIPRLLHNK